MRLPVVNCSRTWAIHPTERAIAKIANGAVGGRSQASAIAESAKSTLGRSPVKSSTTARSSAKIALGAK